MRRTVLLTMLILAILCFSIIETYIHGVLASSTDFELISYNYKSSAGTSSVYPGSRNVELSINVRYISTENAIISTACLMLPEGFSASRGSSQCSSPYFPNGTAVYSYVVQNDVIVFRYRLDIEADVNPGDYDISIVIYYRKGGGVWTPYEEVVEGISIVVEPYPELSIDIVDWYWSPEAYPGSQGVYLYIVLKNSGDSAVLQADGIAKLPSKLFTPDSIRFRIPSLNKYSTTTVSLGPISVSPSTAPETPYTIELAINATMNTDDNVMYVSQTLKHFSISLMPAPPLNLEVLDYGLEGVRIVENTLQTRFYVTMINRDFKTIRSIIAYFTILSSEAIFINGTRSSVTTYQQVLDYGGTTTLYSSPLIIGTVDKVSIELKLVIFGEDRGSEFWSENTYYFTVTVGKPYLNLVVVDSYWVDGEVYPGSSDARIAIVLENYDIVDIRDLVATLELPHGLYPNTIKLTDIDISKGSRSTLIFSGISIGSNVAPGAYTAKLDIDGIAVEGVNTFYRFQNSYTVILTIAPPCNQTILETVEYGWISKRAYVNSIGSRLYVYFVVSEPGFRIQNPVFTLHLPKQMIFQTLNRSLTIAMSGVFEYSQNIYVEVPNIDVVAADEGLYPVIIRVRALATSTQSFWYDRTYTLLLPIYSPKLNLTLIDSGWWNTLASATTSGANAYLTLQSLNIDTLNSLIIQLELDGINAKFVDGRSRSIYTVTGPINYGSIFTAFFTDIEINGSQIDRITAKATLIGIIQSYGMYYTASESYSLEFSILPELRAFIISSIHTQYGGNYAPLLPSARNIFIYIDLANTKPYPIAWIKPKAYRAPDIVKINDISGSCLYGTVAAGTCSLILNVDIDSKAQMGGYSIALIVEYAVQSGNAISVYGDTLEIPIVIAPYEYYKSIVRPATWYWGIQTPTRALEKQRNTPLTVIIINNGPYPVNGVEVELEPIDRGINMVSKRAFCAPVLNVGGSCSATLYVDLLNISSNNIKFYVNIYYVFSIFGTNINDRVGHNISLYVDRGASGEGLEIIDWGWINGWPAYPNTNNATYYITAVNNWPYRISGIKLVLNLPEGFSSKEGNRVTSYVPGPIASLQQFTTTFSIDVGDVKPGRYSAVLEVKYIVETGTPNIAITDSYSITISVNDPRDSVSLVTVQWIGATPELGTYGATLAIVIRNNYNPSIKGSVLELYLPEGFTYSATNKSYAKIPATDIGIVEYPRIPSMSYQQMIMNYISQSIQQGGLQQVFEYGNLMYFYVKVNVLVDKPGTYPAKAYLNFIDHWNCIRRIPLEINITVLGSTKIINVTAPIKVKVVNGTSLLSIGITNLGSAPLYNIYVYIVPYTSILLPENNIRYLDVLPPNEVIHISYKLIYNPVAITVGAAQTYMRYMSVPFGVTVVYRDISGFTQYLNTSLSVLLEPFIDLRLEDVKAYISGDTLKVSGVVVNYGIATARSVEARADINGRLVGGTLIGDIDPASQSVFRIEGRVEQASDHVTLSIVYRDEYYIENVLRYKISITIERPTPTYTSQPTQTLQLNHIIVIVAVFLFLSAMAFVFYRYMKKIALQHSMHKG